MESDRHQEEGVAGPVAGTAVVPVERRHELVDELRELEECVISLKRRQGFLVGLVAANVLMHVVGRIPI